MKEIHIDKEIGRGGEHVCYSVRGSSYIAKFLHDKGQLWQQNDADKANRDLEILRKEFYIDDEYQIVKQPIIVLQNGVREMVEYAVTSPLVDDFENHVVKYSDLLKQVPIVCVFHFSFISLTPLELIMTVPIPQQLKRDANVEDFS